MPSIVSRVNKIKATIFNKKIQLIIALILVIILSLCLIISRWIKIDDKKSINNYRGNQRLSAISKNCDLGSNVAMTECLVNQVDRVAAEREWKQKKLENAKHPQINQYDLIGVMSDEQVKISQWRNGFEDARDKWCNAEDSFITGSGVPANIATCQIKFELAAIDDLNYTYYNSIMKNIYDSQGITDFEPKESDIDQHMKTNLTHRGCIWAGEEKDCDK